MIATQKFWRFVNRFKIYGHRFWVRVGNRIPVIKEYRHLIEQSKLLSEQNRFILYQLCRINETMRFNLLDDKSLRNSELIHTRSSFDYQWREFHTGVAMPDDATFMSQIELLLCQLTDLPADWFPGKCVLDLGCGAGRYTYGLLSLGAAVTACDQSAWAVQRTTELCQHFGERFSTYHINLLEWPEDAVYDLVFCFGVVHHTGNTYLAIRNAARKVKPGGRLFLMVYRFPEDPTDLQGLIEFNRYEALRYELRHLPFEQKKRILIERYGDYLGHGWFDATSPQINDLLTWSELVEFLSRLGFHTIKRTLDHRNHHLVADKCEE